MAVIAQTNISGTGPKAVVETTMTASDTLVFAKGSNQILRLRNTTGGPLTVTITGADAVAQTYPEGGTVNYAAGYSTGVIPATTGDILLRLDTLSAYLQGTVTLTGGTGIKASITREV